MKKIIAVLLVMGPCLLFSQNVKYEKANQEVSVDGEFAFTMEKVKSGGLLPGHFVVKDKDGNRIFRVDTRYYSDFARIAPGNPTGRTAYFQFSFFDSNARAHAEVQSIGKKSLAKFITRNDLMKDGLANMTAIDEFILVNGE